MKFNKKGNIDIFYTVLMLLVFMFALIIVYAIISDVGDFAVVEYSSNAVIDEMFGVSGTGAADSFFTNFNQGFMILFTAGFLASLIAGFFVETHPVLAVAGIILMILLTLFSFVLSNLYYEFEQVPELQDEINQFGIPSFFFQHLPKFMVIATGIVVIVTYAKGRGARGGI